MCGIAGYFGKKPIAGKVISNTLHLMRRRGPDGQDVKTIEVDDKHKCLFLHSRLSIIDLDSRSSQPFYYNGKELIFNGEIYNYKEIKNELIRLGHCFITESDTEVLIHALDEWAEAAFEKLEGMWALALYDRKSKTLLLSRDRFGEKPLYIYRPEPDEIYFGSEIKFISEMAQKRFKPNLNHVSRFLVNGYKSLYKVQETFFEGISEISSATNLNITTNGKVVINKYWAPIFSQNDDMTFGEAVSGVRERLLKSVEWRLRSDLPIAFHMSGGVDSNALISIAKKIFNYNVMGFTIVNTDKRYEEQDMVKKSISELGLEHSNVFYDSNDFIDNMTGLIEYHDAPVITISSYLGWLLQREIAKDKFHITINGTAADELFSGYFDHQLMFLYDIQNDKNLLYESIKNWEKAVSPIVRNPMLQSYDNFIKNPFQRNHAYLHNHIFSSYLHKKWAEPFSEKYYRNGLLQNRMANEIFEETTPMMLHEDDLNSMYFSIENRSPFLDTNLFEFCHSIPAKYLIKDGMAKAVLRESMRGITPDHVLNNKRKVGFNAPILELLNFKDIYLEKKLFCDSPIYDLVDPKAIKKLLSKNVLPNSDSKFIFSFLSSKIFLEKFS